MLRRYLAPSELLIIKPTDTELRPQADLFNCHLSPATFIQPSHLSPDASNRLLTSARGHPPSLFPCLLLTLQPSGFRKLQIGSPHNAAHPSTPLRPLRTGTCHSLAWDASFRSLPLTASSSFSVTAVPLTSWPRRLRNRPFESALRAVTPFLCGWLPSCRLSSRLPLPP